jgi:hypothetical protein
VHDAGAAASLLPFTDAADGDGEPCQSVVLEPTVAGALYEVRPAVEPLVLCELPSEGCRPSYADIRIGDTNWRDDGILPSGDRFIVWIKVEHA